MTPPYNELLTRNADGQEIARRAVAKGLVYEAGDGPVQVLLTADGEVWLRPKPDASCTLTAQIVFEAV